MRDEDVQREIDRAVENKTTTGWRKRQIARHDDDDIQDYVRPWVGLTDEEWEAMYYKFAKHQEYGAFVSGWEDFYKAIETKLKEKNHG